MSSILFIFLVTLVFWLSFVAAWIGTVQFTFAVYLFVFLLLLFMSYLFLNGVRYIIHTGKKITADVCSLDIFDEEQFYAVFRLHKRGISKEKHFIFRYEMDGTLQYELQYKRALWNVKIGGQKDIYVISHKEGVKTSYEMKTDLDIIRNLTMGVPFAIELVAWVVLFAARGL